MAIVYRPQRSEIRDGMAKLNAFDTIEELLAHVKQEWKSQYPAPAGNIPDMSA